MDNHGKGYLKAYGNSKPVIDIVGMPTFTYRTAVGITVQNAPSYFGTEPNMIVWLSDTEYNRETSH
jgi:hypothetical protein